MIHAVHKNKLPDEQLIKLIRYIFSDEFAEEFIELDMSSRTNKEKKEEFDRIYQRSIAPLELLN